MDMYELTGLKKEELPEAANRLKPDDIAQLVLWLNETEDAIRYPSFLLLQYRTELYEDVYPYWRVFLEKLESENSFQRSIGLMMLARNAKWDKENRLDAMFDRYLSFCDDEKIVSARQCVQNLRFIMPYKIHLWQKTAQKLCTIDVAKRKDTHRRVLLKDILEVLLGIQNEENSRNIDGIVLYAMNGELLNRKEKEDLKKVWCEKNV